MHSHLLPRERSNEKDKHMWNFDRPISRAPDMNLPELRVADLAKPSAPVQPSARQQRSPARKVRLNLPSTHVPLFHAWRP